MVDGLHIPVGNRTKKPLAIALSGAEKGLREEMMDNVNNVQYMSSQNCHYESPHIMNIS
jgi:hypothetical protein